MDDAGGAPEAVTGYLLDTHLWLWFQEGDRDRIEPALIEEIDRWQRQGKVFVSDASVWEIALLVARRRILLSTAPEDWMRTGTEDGGFRLLELSTEVLVESTRLPGELHRDPADRMLLATAMVHDLTLVTRDKAMVRYGKQGFVTVIKR